MSFQKDYVVGFAFDMYGAVALIQKKRPEWQAGCWNGIGGSREPGEVGPIAMAREFEEETGMFTNASQWKFIGKLHKAGSYRCLVYVAWLELLNDVRTVTDERVRVFKPEEFELLGSLTFPCVHNLPALIALARMPADPNKLVPLFELDYTHGVAP